MRELFASGRLVDLILVLVVVEAGVIAACWRLTGKGIRALDLVPNLFAGAFLLLALRASLTGQDWTWSCACLAVAGLAHVVDIARRWRN